LLTTGYLSSSHHVVVGGGGLLWLDGCQCQLLPVDALQWQYGVVMWSRDGSGPLRRAWTWLTVFFVSARTNKRHHHLRVCGWQMPVVTTALDGARAFVRAGITSFAALLPVYVGFEEEPRVAQTVSPRDCASRQGVSYVLSTRICCVLSPGLPVISVGLCQGVAQGCRIGLGQHSRRCTNGEVSSFSFAEDYIHCHLAY